jgi:DNA-binding IclR family transcriptional regulator
MGEIQSLARGLKTLNLLAQSHEAVSITRLAEILQVDKASASRLVSTLAHYGYAEKDPASRRYQLGPQVMVLSRSLVQRWTLGEVTKPYLHQLMERTGECAHLAVAFQEKALYLDQVESPATLRVNVQVGQTAPLHCTALGKALLAFGKLGLPNTLERYTSRTITQPDKLSAHLAQVRRQGYAVDDEEYEIGVRCVAVPVVDYQQKVVGAIGISGPATRVTDEKLPELAHAVADVGRALSEQLQFPPRG